MPSPSSPWASVTTAGAAGPAASRTELALCCSRSPAANLDMAGRRPTAQSKTGLTGSRQLARFRGSFWPCFSPSDLLLHALDTFTNAALQSLGGIENVSLMPHLDAGELAALATALRWQRGREAGTHGCWQRNRPSVALTCVCTLGCLVASPCLSPPWHPPGANGAAWTQRCTQGDVGPGRRAQPLAGQPRSGVAQPRHGAAHSCRNIWQGCAPGTGAGGRASPKASSVRGLRAPQGPACQAGCGLHRCLASAPSAHAGPVPGLPAGLVCPSHPHCTPRWDPLWKSWLGTMGRPEAFPPLLSAHTGRPVAPHAGL